MHTASTNYLIAEPINEFARHYLKHPLFLACSLGVRCASASIKVESAHVSAKQCYSNNNIAKEGVRVIERKSKID
jgi:hypothetical protein